MMLLLLLLALLIIIIFLLEKKKTLRKILQPPGPPGLPFIGNLHQFSSRCPYKYLWQLSRKYGPLMSMRFGSVPVLIISSARIAQEALQTNDLAFSSRPATLVPQKLTYNGLDFALAPYSDYWKEMKKFSVLHLLNLKRVQCFRPIREEEVYYMIRKIAKLAASSQLVNLNETSMGTTVAIICRAGFGKRLHEGFERKRFILIFRELQAMLAAIFYSDFFPSLGWLDKISGKLGRLEKNFQDFDSFYQEILEDHLNQNQSKTFEEDMVDIILNMRDEKSFPFDLTNNHIKALLMNVFIGATGSSSAILVWAMTALMKNSMVMEKVQVEIRQLIGDKGIVNEDDLQNLPYFKAVIKETLRLYPPNPLLLPRETMKKCNIDGYEIQPKTIVYFNAWGIARDPKYWKNAEEFLPERFLDSTIDYKGQNFEFIPFGAGRRRCPGMSLGMATVELALANLLYSFDWELPYGMKKEDIDMDVLPGWTMQRKNDLCLIAKNYA